MILKKPAGIVSRPPAPSKSCATQIGTATALDLLGALA